MYSYAQAGYVSRVSFSLDRGSRAGACWGKVHSPHRADSWRPVGWVAQRSDLVSRIADGFMRSDIADAVVALLPHVPPGGPFFRLAEAAGQASHWPRALLEKIAAHAARANSGVVARTGRLSSL